MTGPYRDDTTAILDRIAVLQSRLNELEANLTSFFWTERAAHFGLDSPTVFATESLGTSLTSAEKLDRLEHRIAAIEEVRAKLPLIEEVRLELPSHPPRLELLPDCPPSRADDILSDPNYVVFRREIEGVARSVDLSPLRQGGVGGPAVVDGLPLTVICARRVEQGARSWDSTIGLGTSVPVALKKVEVGSNIELDKPVSTGERSFDGLFGYRGSMRTMLELLATGEVQEALFEIAKQDVPRVRIEKSEAWVSWCASPKKRAFESAMIVLHAARRLEPPRLSRKNL